MDKTIVSVNSILKEEITKIDHTLVPNGFCGDAHYTRRVQEFLSEVVDKLGHISAAAQGLNKAITTRRKLLSNPRHVVYLLKDAAANDNEGEVVGLLKIGHKHLYLADKSGKTVEVEPLCVLDFYVKQDRQRHGLGKKLFDFMLQDTNTPPHHLAVDGPSPIMLQFLEKTYGMRGMIRNVNNFAVAPSFFDNIDQVSKSNCSTPASTSSGAGRFSAPKPESDIGKIIHGDNSHNYNMDQLSQSRYNRIY